MFREMYIKAGGLERKLSNAELSELLARYKDFEEANYEALETSIEYRFKAELYEPEPITRPIPLVLAAGVTEYTFKNYQVLQNTILQNLIFPVSNSFNVTLQNKAVLQYDDLCKAFITINNDRQQTIVDGVCVLDYIRDSAYQQGKGIFKQSRIDWSTSKIEFADSTVPNANVGAVIYPVVKYLDMKRYPYLSHK